MSWLENRPTIGALGSTLISSREKELQATIRAAAARIHAILDDLIPSNDSAFGARCFRAAEHHSLAYVCRSCPMRTGETGEHARNAVCVGLEFWARKSLELAMERKDEAQTRGYLEILAPPDAAHLAWVEAVKKQP